MSEIATMQPGLRALMMFEKVPEGCVTFPCTDASSMPHVRPGEFVVVDKTDREPVHGELYVVSFGPRRHQHHICMLRRKTGITWRCSDLPQDGWEVGAVRNDELRTIRRELDRQHSEGLPRDQFIAALLKAQMATGAWSEGPYASEGDSFDHLCDCLIGRVIGIYAPSFEEPNRGGLQCV
ncbi:S24/S26 family peptidase [Brucella intermedia]|uniref:S24/S26 family peptidase n=1 Tax=Brucella intermedia TaxID=94625 RepID=UPI0007C6B3D0|nr:S24/S26 family peptidase [Brucella intermedia]OAE39613.1 hypothetical protein A7J42_13955 [Brucella intermedia]